MNIRNAGKKAVPTIMVVDDDENILQVLEARLLASGMNPLLADCAETALEMLADQTVDCVVSDVKMPGMGGQGLLREILATWPAVPVIMLTAHGAIPDAVDFIQAGAADYLTKPFDGRELVGRIQRAIEARDEKAERPSAEIPATGETETKLLGGKAPAMAAFLERLARVARSDANVLLLGESGTGKELAARILHEAGPRAAGPFVVVDCGSTQPTLLESELFGHVKGAFTHAVRDKQGLIETADGGTLFLDEIGNISPEMQTRLLRFLQEGTLRRVGDTVERSVSCRVAAATNADLAERVRSGDFREDLYSRLKVVTLSLPPLRARREDVPELARAFVADLCREQGRPLAEIADDAMDALLAHPWPGNVRELRHSIESALVFCDDDVLRAKDFQLDPVPDDAFDDELPLSLDESERRAIVKALEHSNGV